MTTLGALLVGLLLLLLFLGVFAWLQRRPRRGPEQPRTVADLVRMREAARPYSDDAEPAAAAPSEPAESTDDEPEPVEARPGPVAVAEPRGIVESSVADETRRHADAGPDEPGAAAPVVGTAPEDAVVDMPWARAARMVEPWPSWGATASDEPEPQAEDAAPVEDRPRPSLTLLSSEKVDTRSSRVSYWAARTKSDQRPSTPAANPVIKPAAFAPGPQADAADPGGSLPDAADSPAKPADSPADPDGVVKPPSERTDSPAEAAGSPAGPVDSRAASAGVVRPLAAAAGSPAVPVDSRAEPADSQVESVDSRAASAGVVRPLAASAGSPAVPVDSRAEPADSQVESVDSRAAAAGIVRPLAKAAGSPAVPVDSRTPPVEAIDPPAVSADPSADVVGPAAEPAEFVNARPGTVAPPADASVGRPAEVAFVAARTPSATVAPQPAVPSDAVEAPAAVAEPSPARAVVSTESTPRIDEALPADVTHTSLPPNGHGPIPTPARVAGRVRRRPSATPAEQAAADLALLRTFGVAGRNGTADEPEVELEGCTPDDDEPVAGDAQPIAFRVLARDGRGIHGATVTLLDDHGRETASTRTRSDGHGVLTARHPGGYMLVTAADGYQPGAITVAVTDAPVDAEIPLTRSASIAGSVGGEDGPIVGAQLVLVQDGEIVDTTESAADGAYRFVDLAAGEYGLSVTAYDCEAVAFVLALADEADLRQDIDLVPAGLPSDDVLTAPR